MARGTFSESWHQVAELRLGLLPTVRVHKQAYREQIWFVLQDACSDKFYRVQPSAYGFLARLTPRRTVEEIWTEYCAEFPDTAPSQDDVIALLGQLHQMNLLFFRAKGESQGIFERYRKNRRKEKLTHLMALLYLRIPIWDPDALLRRNIHWLRLLFSPLMFALWCLVLVLAGRAVLEQSHRLWDDTQGLLALDNLIWLALSLFVLKFLHEMGHAIASRKYGAGVHTIGIMFIALMPLPYTDASASWSLRSPRQRALVAAAGMYVELLVAGLAALVWAHSPPGLMNALAFNLMIIGSVSSLVFNGNPLLKFDAYYMLADLTGLPNLYQRSSQQWLYLAKRYLLRVPDAVSPAKDRYETYWYLGYAVGSIAYRLVVMVVITLFMADISLVLGVLMVLTMSYIWIVAPTYKLLRYLTRSAEVQRMQGQAIGITLASVLLVGLLLAALPMPQGLRAPGVVAAAERMTLYADSGGQLLEVMVRSGDPVVQGQPLLRFSHPQLELERELVGQQVIEVRWLLRQATEATLERDALQEREQWLLTRLDDIEQRLAALQVNAPITGVWVSTIAQDQLGAELARGSRLGTVMGLGAREFVAVVSQAQAANLFDSQTGLGEVRLRGLLDDTLPVESVRLIPYERRELPAASLGIPGGGSIPARIGSDGRMLALEPFFEVRAQLSPDTSLPDGQTGVIRVALAPAPPLQQLHWAIQQMLKARYQL